PPPCSGRTMTSAPNLACSRHTLKRLGNHENLRALEPRSPRGRNADVLLHRHPPALRDGSPRALERGGASLLRGPGRRRAALRLATRRRDALVGTGGGVRRAEEGGAEAE